MAVFTSLKFPDLQWLYHRTAYFSSEKLWKWTFTAAISDWSICVTWVGGGAIFLMCFLEGPTSQPTRLAVVLCWRKIVRIRLKRASQQERNVFITSWYTYVQSTCVAGTDSRNIIFSLSNIVALLLSWPCSDLQRKSGLLLLLWHFLLKSKQVTREVHFRCTYL